MTDLIWASIISVIFLLLFIGAEIAHKKGINTECTRKFVHFGGAFVTIFFPFILTSHWTVLALAAIFALIMFLSKKLGLLQSIHDVERKSEGAIYHPIAIYACFLYSQILNQPMFYVISILILAKRFLLFKRIHTLLQRNLSSPVTHDCELSSRPFHGTVFTSLNLVSIISKLSSIVLIVSFDSLFKLFLNFSIIGFLISILIK